MNHPADLHIPFLNKVLEKMRAVPLGDSTTSDSFYEFVPNSLQRNEDSARLFVAPHLDYLEEIGLVRWAPRTRGGTYGVVKLTAQGRNTVQPELAQFYGDVLGRLVPALEAQIDGSTLPEDEKQTFKYKLKEALATHGPDIVVKFIVELLSKLAKP